QDFAACRFADRCPSAWDLCHSKVPAWHRVDDRHEVRCHLFDPAIRRESAGTSTPDQIVVGAEAPRRDGPLLDVTDLKVHFPIRTGLFRRAVGFVKAVDGVSLRLAPGRTLALVGESGCGKTTVGKAILQLIRPTAGSVRFRGTELSKLPES